MSNLSRRQFVIGGAVAAAATTNAQPRPAPASRPNVMLIIAEDLSSWMCGCYGGSEIKTPNIDLLARLGTRFHDALTITPAGSPGRASLLTGRTPMQHGIVDFISANTVADPPQGQTAAPSSFANELMLSDLLSSNGYNCGFAGLWDMGDFRQPGHGLDWSVTVGPDVPYRNPTLSRNGETGVVDGYLSELITNAGAEYLDRQSPGKPFCLTLSYPNPREPYEGHPEQFYEMYSKVDFDSTGWLPVASNARRGKKYAEDAVASIRRFAAGVSALDAQIPVLFDKLRAKKLWTDTLLVFTSATGHLMGRHGLWGGGLASDPINLFDDALRIPLIVSWPGEIPIEGARPELVTSCDLLPTILEACAVAPPADRNLCGRSFLTRVADQRQPKDTEKWPEFVYGTYRDTHMVRDNRYKVVVHGDPDKNEFYSFARDPRELRNEYNNRSFVTVRDRMEALIAPWMEKYSS